MRRAARAADRMRRAARAAARRPPGPAQRPPAGLGLAVGRARSQTARRQRRSRPRTRFRVRPASGPRGDARVLSGRARAAARCERRRAVVVGGGSRRRRYRTRAGQQPALEQVRGGARVLVGAPVSRIAPCDPRGEALIVQHDWHRSPRRSARRRANSRVSRVWSESSPLSDSGSPTTTRSTRRSRTSRSISLHPASRRGGANRRRAA